MTLQSLDIALLNWLHDNPVPGSVPFMQFVSDTTTALSIGLAAVMLAVWLFRRQASHFRRFISLLLVLLIVAGATQGLKKLIPRDRPFERFPEKIEKLSTGGDSSFPSGHTLEAFAVAASLSFMFRRRRVVIPIYAWACLVGYTRIALGVHYPSDVAAGILAGTLIGLAIPWLVSRYYP